MTGKDTTVNDVAVRGAAPATGATVEREVGQDVAEVLIRYATGIDQRDWPLFRTCFTEDCEADYGAIGAWSGADAITEWMERSHAPCGHTLHRITNQVSWRSGTGVAARSYVDAVVMMADNQNGTRAIGYYDDDLVLTGDGWKIARRRFTLVHLQMKI